MSNNKIYTEKKWGGNYISLHLFKELNRDTISVAQKVLFIEADRNAIHEPAIDLKLEEAQELMDQLWTCGLRPTEGSGSAGSLDATQKHLKDMQRIAFGLLKPHGVE